MKLRWISLVTAALLLGLLIAPFQTANAYADVTDYTLTCSSFTATGTSDAPYVTLYVTQSIDDVVPLHYVVIPVIDGTYSGTLTFPAYPAGTELDFEVWGTLNPNSAYEEDGYWDDDVWFYEIERCVPVVEIGPSWPVEFEMRSVICDTPIYESAGGAAIANGMVYAGQTFYGAAVDTVAPNGSRWIQIFVGGWENVFIPADCVL